MGLYFLTPREDLEQFTVKTIYLGPLPVESSAKQRIVLG